ncbi:MAG: aminodeoxychorismate synthase component I [Legionellales bacterium]
MSAYQLTALDYVINLQEFYQKLGALPGFVLLESTHRSRGRYDILSACPYEQIRIPETCTTLEDELKKCAKMLPVEQSELDLPFQGGAIGYIAYDLGARLLGLKSPSQPGLEGMPLLDLGLYDWAIIADHHLKKVTLFSANRHASTKDITQKALQLWHSSSVSSNGFKVTSDFNPLTSKASYQEAFYAIQDALKSGRSYQVNLTQPFHAAYEGDAWQIYRTVSMKNPVPFSAFLRTADAALLSFSPERFLLYDNGRLLTSPIKGTSPRSINPLEDERLKKHLAACPKNRAENVMIVDLLRNDFGKIAKAGTVQVANLFGIQSYNSVHHLVSDICAICLDDISPFVAFMSCFPGGSITGAPKLESMRIIHEQESYARGVYCGSIGYLSHHGRFDANIAIRTVTAKNNTLHLAAGGGIVFDSNCEDEYQECYTKIAAVVNALR